MIRRVLSVTVWGAAAVYAVWLIVTTVREWKT